MSFLFRHFPLVFIVVVAINAVIARRRVPRFVEAYGGDEAGAIRFVWIGAAVVAAYFFALDLSAQLLGRGPAMCVIPSAHPQAHADYIAWAIWIAFPVALALWVWFFGGAPIMARYSPLYARYFRPGLNYSAWGMRVLTLFILSASVILPLELPGARELALSCASGSTQIFAPSDSTHR